MSEANNVWRVEIQGTEQEIEHTMTDKHTIKVDGKVVEEGRKWGFGANEHEFEVAGQQAIVKIDAKYGGLAYGSSLHLDGRYVEPLGR
ncbi:MAG: hypothetical protein ACR2ML_04455 [Solirubrobacteraceae bacterium]